MQKSPFISKQALIIIVQDILLLAILTYSVYEGHKDMDQFSSIFVRNFIPLALTTVLGSKFLIRRLRKGAEQQSTPPSAA